MCVVDMLTPGTRPRSAGDIRVGRRHPSGVERAEGARGSRLGRASRRSGHPKSGSGWGEPGEPGAALAAASSGTLLLDYLTAFMAACADAWPGLGAI